MKTKVVHLMREKYDIAIDRSSKWGNPFTHKDGTMAKFKVATREEAIEKYREYILNNEELMSSLDELKGKVLGCWCKPKACHGDILVELIENKEDEIKYW
jgi:polynucleotide 5'-kinase involved in rRNA processing